MKKIKCKVCGTRFPATKESLYLAAETIAFLTALSSTASTYECFDCPTCGCQYTAGIRMSRVETGSQEDDDE